jgi:lipopolysaccharide transport system ATP-binding protein
MKNMDDLAIRVENLGKLYRIGETVNYGTLRDTINKVLAAPFRRRSSRRNKQDFIWALKDISFQVKRGEVIGIIGPNGSGKSTMLKILSRITNPTEGTAEIYGRIGALLEVGTGFHTELTGSENIYLNGAILGMRRTEISRKFNDIVEFSGVEKFINTPLKRYSSGMQMRLAFAVSAYLEPEILLVDEVLAVGDLDFQRKCLNRMDSVAKGGRTILFVSHNMAAIRSLCQRTVYLAHGQIEFIGETGEAISRYVNRNPTAENGIASSTQIKNNSNVYLPGGKELFQCDEITILDSGGKPKGEFDSDEDLVVSVSFRCLSPVPALRMIVQVETMEGVKLLRTENLDEPDDNQFGNFQPGSYQSRCVLPKDLFGQGTFFLSVWLLSYGIHHIGMERILKFDTKFKGYNNNLSPISRDIPIRPRVAWHTKQLGSN